MIVDSPNRTDATWVRQGSRLWVGRSDGRPIGTIEQGRRFVFVDLDGTPSSGHRSLAAAQQAQRKSGTDGARRASTNAGERILMGFTGGAALAATALLVAAAQLPH